MNHVLRFAVTASFFACSSTAAGPTGTDQPIVSDAGPDGRSINNAGPDAGTDTDTDGGGPFFTVRIEGARPAAALRVTTVWLHAVPDGKVSPDRTLSVGASVELPASLPATAHIPATLPPIAARLMQANGDYAALGRILVYEDGNGNGQFDLTDASAGALVDRIVGYVGSSTAGAEDAGATTSSHSIGYVQGTPPSGIFTGAPAGYSVLFGKEIAKTVTRSVLPLSTTIPVKMVTDVPELSCAGVNPWPSGPKGGDGLDNVIDAPLTGFCPGNLPQAGAAVTCIAPGLNSYFSTLPRPTAPTIAQLCGPVLERCLVRTSAAAPPFQPIGGAAPAGWPCP